ncbi:MAG: hypothetical protein NC420_00090 [Eubacterium sp.]|nr:hypothetical protein [Eubacterium sp.]MCM1213633.1 hypothetical protein [Lachnospiraceae bacterium]MCM1237755.1 hypothetical protein [Lachnospiraceae bacterium]
MEHGKESRGKCADHVFFGMLLALYALMMLVFFYRQAIEYQGNYYSDMKAYILETQGLESGFDFPYRLFFWLSRIWMIFVTPEAAVAFSTMLLDVLCVILVKYYFNTFLADCAQREGVRWNLSWRLISTVAVFSLFFMSMIYSERGEKFWSYDYIYRCNGIYTANPYWNATFLAVRPFTVLGFFLCARVLSEYEKAFSWRDGILAGISVFLATFTKPSFTFILGPVLAATVFWRLFAKRFAYWKNTVRLCGCFLPTVLLLVYQFQGVFMGTNARGEETGIGFEVGKAWHLFTGNIPLSIMMALLFPLSVLALNWKELKRDGAFRLAWQLMAVGFLSFLLLYEKGFRLEHMNFSWGYMHGLFFVFLISILQMLKNAMKRENLMYKLLLTPELVTYAYHLICGIVFFCYMYQGNNAGAF